MALHRENILSLIGSRRYHSAILTTFCFDFYFFEMKAMKWLRSCGIRNVNVMIDGYFYSELMRQLCGEEMHLTPGYSLYPIFQKSIFHPKIWMLIGDKEGLFIVGSGNLTNAGNGNNDEIWGAFHFDIRIGDNAQLFSAAWSYIKQLCSTVKGFTHEKTTRWIVDHAKWLQELPTVKPFQFANTARNEKIAFLANTGDSTIWQQLSALIGKEKIVEITTLSPFYDTNGKAIQALKSLFPSSKINVVIDESGSVPEALPQSKVFSFYDWYDLGVSKSLHSKAETINPQSKLHAKIIQFRTNSGREFCLFGSANVTPEGLGLPGASANNEVSLLIQSDVGGLLNRLGVKLKTAVKLSEFNVDNNNSIYDSIIKHNRYKVKLLSAEWVYDELYLYAEGSYSNALIAKMYDRENRLLHSVKIGEFKIEMRSKPSTSLSDSHHVQLYDATNDAVVSNKILLADYYLLAKTHPNPETEEIERIYSDIQSGDLSRVLDLLHYAIHDETESFDPSNVLAKKNAQVAKTSEKPGPDKLYDLSTYKPIGYDYIEKSLLLSSLSLRVLDVLKFIRSKEYAKSTQMEIRVDEQEPDIGSISGMDEQEVNIIRNIPLALMNSQKKKLQAYFDNLYKHQQFLIYSNDKRQNHKPTLTDLTRYLIALELMLEFGGKSDRYVEKNKENYFSYLDLDGNEPYYNDNVKGCSLNIIGDFLMLARSGFKEYDFDYTKKKVQELKTEALVSSIVSLLNIKWKELEVSYFNTLLLNSLHYLGEKSPDSLSIVLPVLMKDIHTKIASLKHPSYIIPENLEWFKKRIITAFGKTIRHLADKQFDTITNRGKIIYKSPWGYCFVKDVSKQNDFTLIRPGFIWDEFQGDFVKHTNDEVYKPLRIPKFISVEI